MTKKPFFETSSPGAQKLEALRQLFPQAIETDELGRIRINAAQIQLAVDPTNTAALGKEEDGYELRWVGKREAYHKTSEPHQKILRPLQCESRGWESTGNLLIKGDNLEALKLLRQSYFGAIKLIYIDPPYNTTSEAFIYRDDFTQKQSEVLEQLGYSADALEYVKNIYGARTHSGWLSFMYPRLLLAKDLLRDDGVIFISIDDNEQAQLKLLCDEVFGQENFVASFIWQHRKSSQNDVDVSLSHNSIHTYAKNRNSENLNSLSIDEKKFSNPDLDARGDWVADPMDAPGIRENLAYPIENPETGDVFYPPSARHWRFTEDKFLEALKDKRIIFGKTGKSRPQFKRFKSDAVAKGVNPFTIWSELGTATEGTKELLQLFSGAKIFETPKPTRLLKEIGKLASEIDSIILDFFAGSGTTGEAVMRLNAEDQGNRKFILVQIPQPIDAKKQKEAYEFVTQTLKKPEATIFEITAERLRRAGTKIEAELAGKDATKKEASGALFITADGQNDFKLDTGFRIYELSDDPNALILRKSLADATQADVLVLQDAIATPQPEQEPQILANLLLAEGLSLSSNFEPLIAAAPQAVQVAGDVAFVLHAVPLEDLVDALRARKAQGQTVQHICVYAPWINDDNFLQGISTLLEAEGYGPERLRLRG